MKMMLIIIIIYTFAKKDIIISNKNEIFV